VANDVGALNRRLFLLFLAVHVGAFAHGAAVCASVTRAALGAAVARSAFRVRGGVRLDAAAAARLGALAATQLAFYVCGPVVVVGAAFAVLAAVLGAFTAWHVKMVGRAETTNENAKWAAVADAQAVWDAAHGAGAFVAALRSERRGGRGGGMGDAWVGATVNVYDRGVVANVADVLAPGRLLRLGQGRSPLPPVQKAK